MLSITIYFRRLLVAGYERSQDKIPESPVWERLFTYPEFKTVVDDDRHESPDKAGMP